MIAKRVLTILSICVVFFFAGCGGSSKVGKINSRDYSFLYNNNNKEINGYFTVALDKILPQSQNNAYTRNVRLTNFVIDTGSCGKISQTIDPSDLVLNDGGNISQKVNVDITLNGPCSENSFTLKADKIITITYKDSTKPSQIIKQDFIKTFNIQDNYDYPPSALNEIVVTPSEFNITNPGEVKEIEVSALNSNKELLEKNLTISAVYGSNPSKDYGSVNKHNIITSTSSKVSFFYTAPSNIFDINGTQAVINVVDNDSGRKAQVKINFITNSEDSGIISQQYRFQIDLPGKLKIDDEQYATIKIINKTNGKLIDGQDIKNVNIVALDPSMISFANGKSSFEYNESSIKSLLIKSLGKSGIAMIKIKATVFDGKNDVNIEQKFPITILSGPINSISLVYKETMPYDDTKPQFTNIYTIHAVDKYGNPANKGEKVYVGAIAGITKSYDGSDLYSDNGGVINYDGNKVTFKTDKKLPQDISSSSYKNVLIILANSQRYNPDYIGGWDIANKIDDYHISLNDGGYDIKFTNIDGLSYVIGSERRVNECTDSIAVADIDSNDGLYEIGENGKAEVKLTYDPYLVGKTVYLYVNSAPNDTDSVDKRKRVGVSVSDVLFGGGIEFEPKTVSNDANTSQSKTVKISVTEKESKRAVRNTWIHLSADNGCVVNNPDAKTGICSGKVEFNITVPAETTCNLSILVDKEQ